MPQHPYNDFARRIFAGLLAHRTGWTYPVALRRTPAQMSKFWLDLAELLDRHTAETLAAALLGPDLASIPPASRLKH